MFYVYVLKSLKNNKRYVGFTSKFPSRRLQEHNHGASVYTSNNRPFELVYFEEYKEEMAARKREKFFKTGAGRSFLNKKL